MSYKDNPFYILGASITDNRRKIASLCEEKSLYVDSAICESAQSSLTMPQKRLKAEMRWFPDCKEEDVVSIISFITDSAKNVSTDSDVVAYSCSLTQLNAYCASFEEKSLTEIRDIKRELLRISRLFETLDAEEIRNILNEKREKSGFPQIENIADIEGNISEIRLEIKKLISAKLQQFPDDKYIEIVTAISESYSSKRNKGQAVLEDIISEYQLRITDKLEAKASTIIRVAEFITQSADKINIDEALKDLLDALYDWDKMAQPMQLGALTKGGKHSESEKMYYKMRDLSISLHNKFHLSEQALQINEAMQEVFAEMPENLEQLKEDNKTLNRIVENNKFDPGVEDGLNNIVSIVESITKQSEPATVSKIDELLKKTKELNGLLLQLPEERSIEYRKVLCGLVRTAALDLHNEKQQTQSAMLITNTLLQYFSDIEEIRLKLAEDSSALTMQSNQVIAKKKYDELEKLVEQIKTTANNRDTLRMSIIYSMKELDSFIKQIYSGEELTKVREAIGFMVRNGAIEIYNKYKDQKNASIILKEIQNTFGDISRLNTKTKEDLATLYANQLTAQNLSSNYRVNYSTQQSKKNNNGCIWPFVIILLFIVGYGIFSSSTPTSTSSKPRTTYSTPKPTYYSSIKPTSTPTPLTMPTNGRVFYCSTTDRPSSFKVTNRGSSNYYMKFVKAGTNTTVIKFFVRANSTATIDMPKGKLELRYAYGSTWYGETNLFGKETRYAKDEEYYDFSNYTWEISFNSTNNTGNTMDVETISANEF